MLSFLAIETHFRMAFLSSFGGFIYMQHTSIVYSRFPYTDVRFGYLRVYFGLTIHALCVQQLEADRVINPLFQSRAFLLCTVPHTKS